MNDLNTEKSRLEHIQSRWHQALKFAVLIVVIGLVLEYRDDVVTALRTGKFPVHLIGGILVMLGVAGELVIDIFVTIFDRRVDEANASIILAQQEK